MKIFVVLFALATAASALENIGIVFKADQKINDEIYKKFNTKHISYSNGSVVLSDIPESKDVINDKLLDMLEEARANFTVGFPEQGIPSLEPVAIDNFHFFIYQWAVISNDIDFDRIRIEGLQKFLVNTLNFKLIGLTMEFDFTLPEIVLTSLYRFDGTVAAIIPFNPSGRARVDIKRINIRAVASLGTTSDGCLTIKAFRVDFDFEKIKIYMSGLLGDGLINRTLNWVLSLVSEGVVQAQREKVAEAISEFGADIANDLLSTVRLADLLGQDASGSITRGKLMSTSVAD